LTHASLPLALETRGRGTAEAAMSSSTAESTVKVKRDWDIGAITFWSVVFMILYFTAISKMRPHVFLKVEPLVLTISIASTILYSYIFIFGLKSLDLRYRKLTVTCIGIITFIELLVFFILGLLFIKDSMDAYGSDQKLISTMAALDIFPQAILDLIYRGHALIVVGLLTIVDVIIALFHVDPEKRRRFSRLFWTIDISTLIALIFVFLIRKEWINSWTGREDGLRFEAGAITFQLLAANISIVAYNIFYHHKDNQASLSSGGHFPLAATVPLASIESLSVLSNTSLDAPMHPVARPRDARGRFMSRFYRKG
jgi:hypothetical protein